MAMTLKDIRQKYPAYDDLSDTELADKLHSKLYADLPKAQVYEKLGVPVESESAQPEEPKERTGLLGVVSDLARGTSNAVKGGIKFAAETPQMLEDLGENLLEHPGTGQLRGIAQIGAEAADIGKGIVNAPYNLNQYLARKHLLPQVLGKLGKAIPHIPEDTGVEEALGLTPQKGDKFLRGVTEAAGLVAGGAPIAKGIKKLAAAPSKEKLFQRALEQRVDEAAKNVGVSEEKLSELKESLRRDYSSIHGQKLPETTPIGQEEAINIKKSKLQELKPLTEIPEQKVGEIPPEPDTKAIIDQKKSALEKAKTDAEQALGTLDNPRLKGGAKVKKAIEEVHDSADSLYKSARAHYVDQKIKADNGAEIKAVTQDLTTLKDADELAPGYGSGTAEQKALEAQLESLKGEKVNASDIFDLQRTLEKMAEDTRKKQYSGVNDIEFKRLNNLGDRLESHAATLEKRLESVGGKEVQSMIKQANKGWKTWKDLSKRNPIGKAALKGELPTRSMIEIVKNHPGNDFLHALVESDPELKKHMLAAYAGESNVNKLLKPTTLTQKYIEALPEVEEHVNALKEALEGVKEGEVKASQVKKEYDDLVKSMKDAAKEQKIRRDAMEESDKLKKQIKFHEEAIPKLKSRMQEVEKNSAEHKRLQKELDDHKKSIQDKGGRLKELLTFFVKVKGANLVHL
jgi:hypothetical protein